MCSQWSLFPKIIQDSNVYIRVLIWKCHLYILKYWCCQTKLTELLLPSPTLFSKVFFLSSHFVCALFLFRSRQKLKLIRFEWISFSFSFLCFSLFGIKFSIDKINELHFIYGNIEISCTHTRVAKYSFDFVSKVSWCRWNSSDSQPHTFPVPVSGI